MPVHSSMEAGWFAQLLCMAGTGLGCVLAYGLARLKPAAHALLILLAAGMIASVLALDILPESVELGGLLPTGAGLLAGWTAARRLDRWLHRHVPHAAAGGSESYLHSTLLLAFALALHNFPAGFALGSSLLNAPQLAGSIAWAMIVHSVPEGVALGLPFVVARRSPLLMAGVAGLTSLPTLLGAAAGYASGSLPPWVLAGMLGTAGGTILYVVIVEFILPSMQRSTLRQTVTALLAGGCIGVAVLLAAG